MRAEEKRGREGGLGLGVRFFFSLSLFLFFLGRGGGRGFVFWGMDGYFCFFTDLFLDFWSEDLLFGYLLVHFPPLFLQRLDEVVLIIVSGQSALRCLFGGRMLSRILRLSRMRTSRRVSNTVSVSLLLL